MAKLITAFVPYSGNEFTRKTVDQLQATGLVAKVYLLTTGETHVDITGCKALNVDSLFSSQTFRLMTKQCRSPYLLLIIHDTLIEFGQFGIDRLLAIAEGTGSGLVYADYHDMKEGIRTPHPVIDYQLGSIRDDFNFGSVMLFNAEAFKRAVAKHAKAEYQYRRKTPTCEWSQG